MPEVTISFNSEDNASKVIKSINQQLTGMEKAAMGAGNKGLDPLNQKSKKSTNIFKDVQAAITPINQGLELMQKVGRGAVQAFEFAQAGAEIEYTREKFDRLAQSIGTTGDALEDDLTQPIGGMMSKMEGMALATDLVSLGLAKTSDQAVRLTAVASQLNMDMNQLTLTLSNRTKMRFDSLGVAVDGFDEKLKELEATGLSTEEAFTEAFLQQAEEQIEKVGSAADSSIGSYKKLQSSIKDMTDELKLMADDGLEPLLPYLEGFVDYNLLIIKVLDEYNLALGGVLGLVKKYGYLLGIGEKETEDFTRSANGATRAIEQQGGALKVYGEALEESGSKHNELIHIVDNLQEKMTEANEARLSQLSDISAIETTYNEDMKTLTEELLEVQTELAEKRAAGWSEANGSVKELIAKEEELKQKIQEVEAAHDLATKEIILDYAEQKMAADGILTDDEMNWLADKRVEWGLWSEEAKGQLDYVLGEVDRFYNQVNGLTMDMYINLHQNIGTSGGGGAVDGLPDMFEATGTHGMWKTVPPGHPNDDYIVGMSSGEKYMVQTASEARGNLLAGSSYSYNSNSASFGSVKIIVNESSNARETARQIVKELKLQGALI